MRVPVDLFAALLAVPLTARARTVLAEAALQRLGPEQRDPLVLDPASIEHYTGLHRNNARRGIGELVALGLLQVSPAAPGTYRLNPDPATWSIPAADLQRFTRSARERFPEPINKFASTPIPGDSPINEPPNPSGLTTGGLPQSRWIGATAYGFSGCDNATPCDADTRDELLACDPAPPRAVLDFNSSPEELNLAAAAPRGGARAAAAEPSKDPEPEPAKVEFDPALVEAIRAVRRVFGEPAAKIVWQRRASIGAALAGRWPAYVEAVHQAERELAEPGAEPIKNLHGFLLAVAKVRAERAKRQGGAAMVVAPRPGSPPAPGPAPSRGNPRSREAGPPPPPLFPPPSPERIAEIERGYTLQAQANAAKYAPRPRRPIAPEANAAALLAFQERVRASGVQTAPPQPLTGT